MPMSGQVASEDMLAEVSYEYYGKATPDVQDRPNLDMFIRLGNQAYQDVCNYFDWNWVFRMDEFNTAVNQTDPYALDEEAREVLWMTIPANQIKLNKWLFRDWILRYPGMYQSSGPTMPTFYVDAPTDPSVDNGLRVYLGPGPAAEIYTVRYGYMASPAILTFEADEYPIIPAQWQELWKYRWLSKLYRFAGPGSAEKMKMADDAFAELYKRAWLNTEQEQDAVNRWRDMWTEGSIAARLDLNRWLFFGGY